MDADWAPASVTGSYGGVQSDEVSYGFSKMLVLEISLCGLVFILAAAANCDAAECKLLLANAILATAFCAVLLVCRIKRVVVGHRNELMVYVVLAILSFAGGVAGASDAGTSTHRAAVAFSTTAPRATAELKASKVSNVKGIARFS